MENERKSGFWWIMAALLTLCVICWYIGELLGVGLIFAICAIAAIWVAGYLFTKEDKARKDENTEQISGILACVDQVAEKSRQDALDSRALQEQIHEKTMAELDSFRCQVRDAQDCVIMHMKETAETGTEKLTGQIIQTEQKVNDVSEQINKSSAAIEQKMITGAADTAAKLDKLGRQISEQTQCVAKTIEKNEQARQKDAADTNRALDALCGSFENAVAAYQEMEDRMAALEQQNVHLQQLTTLIGTVRSDIAAINETRGFVDEQKSGRKVRIVRDDENKIVVENLMNGDGVRIEKSKMYRDRNLVFEAEFNDVGKMVLSRSYDKKGNLDTEVTYATAEHGKPTLRDVAKEKISNLTKSGKKKGK